MRVYWLKSGWGEAVIFFDWRMRELCILREKQGENEKIFTRRQVQVIKIKTILLQSVKHDLKIDSRFHHPADKN